MFFSNSKLMIKSLILSNSVRFKSNLKPNINLYKGKKTPSTELALRHFDNFYSKIYSNRWQSIRLGLLSPKKYAALLNNFVDFESEEIKLRQIGAYNLRYIYKKNLRRIVNQLKRDKFLKSRIRASSSSIDDSEGVDILTELDMNTESETENIENFFSEAQDSELENNAAAMNLDLNEFVPVTELKYRENVEDDRNYFLFYEMNYEVPITYLEQNFLDIPPLLNLYTFRRNDFSMFPPANLCETNLINYYLMDCASSLPVLVMDIKDGDIVGDFCAAPGGKSLIMYMMMKNCHLFLNDISSSRIGRLRNVFNSFVPKNKQNNIIFSNKDVHQIKRYNYFDKILVDVPCTNDRHSLYIDENNIFSSKRLGERINIPMKQMDILLEALKSIKVNGTVVYSTCSLSPIQNDGVVHMALKKIKETTSLDFSVYNLKESLRPLRTTFQLDFQFKYGVQVLPFLPCNFGPMYFCKLIRNN